MREEAPVEPAQTIDMHNPKNSLDYKGTYTGKMPTAWRRGYACYDFERRVFSALKVHECSIFQS